MNPNNIDIRPDHYGLICRILQQHLNKGSKVYAFGSRVKWTAKGGSDLDLLVDGTQNLAPLKEAFEESSLPYTVDILDAQTIPPHFLEEINSHRVPLLYNWKTVKLGDVIEFNPKIQLPKNTVAKYVEMANLENFRRDILAYETKPYNGGAKFQNDDTLLARITPCLENGKTAYVNFLDKNEIGFGSTEYIVLRAKKNLTNSQFIYYLAISEKFREIAIASMNGSSGRQRVQTDVLKSHEYVLPPLAEQERIASILSAFDDKIEANRKICADLEAAAKLLFRKNFIDHPERDSWEEVRLGDVAEITTGKRPPIKKDVQSIECPFPIIGASGIMGYTSDYLLDCEVITIGRVGTHGIVLRHDKEVWISDNALIFISAYMNFIFFSLQTIDYKSYNRGSTQPLITQGDMKNINIPLPPQALLENFEKTVSPLYGQIKNLQLENRTLAQARDLLLPKLMRGER